MLNSVERQRDSSLTFLARIRTFEQTATVFAITGFQYVDIDFPSLASGLFHCRQKLLLDPFELFLRVLTSRKSHSFNCRLEQWMVGR